MNPIRTDSEPPQTPPGEDIARPVLPYEPAKTSPSGREAFGVVVRTVGLLISVYGAYVLLYLVLGLIVPLAVRHDRQTQLIYGLVCFGWGLTLIRGEWLVRLAYGRE